MAGRSRTGSLGPKMPGDSASSTPRKRNRRGVSPSKRRHLTPVEGNNSFANRRQRTSSPQFTSRSRDKNRKGLLGPPQQQVTTERASRRSRQQRKAALEARKIAMRHRAPSRQVTSGAQGLKAIRKKRKRSPSPIIYALRLLILGIGIGAIVGTLLSVFDPASRITAEQGTQEQSKQAASAQGARKEEVLPLAQEIPNLKRDIETLAAANPNLEPGIFLIDLDTGAYVDWQGEKSLAAASTIKIPILVAFFQAVDQGRIQLNEVLTLDEESFAKGSGELQYQSPGQEYTALEIATKMITISDNTATNMLIKRLGGAKVLNQLFREWGLETTRLNSPLADIEGTNTTSAKELAQVLGMVNKGDLVSLKSRDRLLDIMRMTVNDQLLPQGLGSGAIIAHKTGNIGSLVGDVGIIDLPSGKRYIAAVMVQRPRNESGANKFIQEISRLAYQHFNEPTAQPTTTSTPVRSTGSMAFQ